ncbi:MAG: chitobiase/beta-hexosaminidase C-terminal domain-containing protein [Leptospira sp.]|nr:chitobiase/beta-hexosaminidase C-terminal domain-containing protein [Leptospira sp.]
MRKFLVLLNVLFYSNCILTSLTDDFKNLGSKNNTKNLLPLIALGGVSPSPSSQNSNEVSATINQDGGTIESDDGQISLEIPRGALSESMKITITKNAIPIGSIPDEYLTASEVFKFEPEGLHFAVPAKLTLQYDQGNMEEGQFDENFIKFVYINNDGTIEQTKQISKDKTNNTVVVEIPHFSYGTLLKSQIKSVNGGNSNITFVTKVANSLIYELRNYEANGFSNVGEYFRTQVGILGPFLMRLVDVLGTDPVSATFPDEDFDGDGIRNMEDPYAISPVNVTIHNPEITSISGTPSDYVMIQWSSREFPSTYSIRLNSISCDTGTILQSGTVSQWETPPKGSQTSAIELNTKKPRFDNDLFRAGKNDIRICVYKNGIYGIATKTIIKDITKPTLSVTPEGGTYGKIQTISVSCTDDEETGCLGVLYTDDGSTPRFHKQVGNVTISQIGRKYVNPITTPDGSITRYKFLASDTVGNTSLLKIEDYHIDSIAPSVRINSVQPSTLISLGASPTLDWQSDRDGTYEIKIGNSCSEGILASGLNVTGSANKDIAVRTEIQPATPFVLGENKIHICFTNSMGNIGTTIKTFTVVSHSSYENVSYEYYRSAYYEYFVPVRYIHFDFMLTYPTYVVIHSGSNYELYHNEHDSWVTDPFTINFHYSGGDMLQYPFSTSHYWGRRYIQAQWINSGNTGTISLAQWRLLEEDVIAGNKRNLVGTPR